MKRCSSCGREIAASATVCAACEKWTSEPLFPWHSDAIEADLGDLRALDLCAPQGASPSVAAVDPSDAAAAPVTPFTAASPQAGASLPDANTTPGRSPLPLIVGSVVVVTTLGVALLMARDPAPPGATSPAPTSSRRPSTDAAVTPPTATMRWNTDNREFWVGRRRNAAAFEIAAENTVAIWMRQVRPALVVRCLANSTDVFVFTESAMQMEPGTEDHTVDFSFDGEPMRTERWSDADDHQSLFAPNGSAFVSRMMRARTLRIRYTPHNAPLATAHFHVSGLAELMGPVRRQCESKK